MCIRMCHHFVCDFRCAVKRYGMIDRRMLRKRLPRVQTVDRAGRCEQQMLDPVVATALQDVLKSEDVGVDVGIGIFDRIPHSGLRGQMDHAFRLVLTEKILNGVGIAHVAVDERKSVRFSQLVEPSLFQSRIVVRIEIVDPDDALAAIEQPLRNVKADEAGRAGHENHGCAVARSRGLAVQPSETAQPRDRATIVMLRRWRNMSWSPAVQALSAPTSSMPISSAAGASPSSTISPAATGAISIPAPRSWRATSARCRSTRSDPTTSTIMPRRWTCGDRLPIRSSMPRSMSWAVLRCCRRRWGPASSDSFSPPAAAR